MGSWAWRLTDTQAAQRPERVCVGGLPSRPLLIPSSSFLRAGWGRQHLTGNTNSPGPRDGCQLPGWGWGDGQGGWGSNLVPSQFTHTSCCPCGPRVGLNGSHQHQVSDGFQALPRGWPLALLEEKGQGWGARESPPPGSCQTQSFPRTLSCWSPGGGSEGSLHTLLLSSRKW